MLYKLIIPFQNTSMISDTASFWASFQTSLRVTGELRVHPQTVGVLLKRSVGTDFCSMCKLFNHVRQMSPTT